MSSHCGFFFFFRLIKYLSFVPKIKLKIHLGTGRNRHQGFCIVISSETLSHLAFVSCPYDITFPLEHSLQACLTALVNKYVQGWILTSYELRLFFAFTRGRQDLQPPFSASCCATGVKSVCLRSALVAPIESTPDPAFSEKSLLETWKLTCWLSLLHYVQLGCCVPAVSHGAVIWAAL